MSYLPESTRDWYLREVVVCSKESTRIEQAPQGSALWHMARKYRMSGSRIGEILGHGFRKHSLASACQMFVWPQPISSPWIAWGSACEKHAQKITEEVMRKRFFDYDVTFEYPGGIVINGDEWFIASVDGLMFLRSHTSNLIEECILLEFKCPKVIHREIRPGYVDQVQAYMGFLRTHDPVKFGSIGRCIFGQWTPEKTSFQEFKFDQEYFERIKSVSFNFYNNELVPRFILAKHNYLPKMNSRLPKHNDADTKQSGTFNVLVVSPIIH